MLRRTFLAQSALATGAVLLNQSCTPSKPSPKGPAIGLQLYTVRDEVKNGIVPVIEKIASVGYTHLETFGFADGMFFGKTPKEFRNLLYDNEIIAPSGHYYHKDYVSGKSLDPWKKACEAASILEHEYIVLPYIEAELRPTTPDGFNKLAEKLNSLAKVANEAGMQFAYHNHDFEFKYNPEAKTDLYSVLLNQTDPALVKMELDLFWIVFSGGDPVTLFYQQPGRFPMVHVKDLDPITRKNSDLGKGIIDFPGIFKYKKEAGLKYFFVEQENYNVSPYDSIEKNIAYIKKSLLA